MTLSPILERCDVACLVFECIPPCDSKRKEIAITCSDGTTDGQKPPLRVDTHSQSITRKPVMSAVTEYNIPDSLNGLARLIDESVLDKIAPIKQRPTTAHAEQEADEDNGFVLDEDTLDRRSLALIQRVLSGGDSD
jgi:guanylate kinase